MSSEMKIQIPEQLISDTIRAEIVRQIGGENKDKLVYAVVEHAMTGKKDSYSSTPTYFQEAVNGMIRDVACNIFREWLEANRDAISKALKIYLTSNKQEMLTELCENLAKNITQYGITIDLQLRDR